MSLDSAKNFAKVQVSQGYAADDTSIALVSGDGALVPTAPVNGVWFNATDYPDPADDPNVEIVRVTAESDDTLTVTRAQESTSASAKNTAGKTYLIIFGPTAKLITDITTDIAAVASDLADHVADTDNPHEVTASDISLGNVTNDAQLKREAGDFASFTAKTTPVDADIALIEDSAASNAKKKLTWANIKATLKTYFDSIYQAIPGAWQTWIPTWSGLTIGNATVTARYCKIGKLVFFRLVVAFGSTSSFSGNFKFTLPASVQASVASWMNGEAEFYDAGTIVWHGRSVFESATECSFRVFLPSGSYISDATVSNSIPFTWSGSAGDTLACSGFYEAA
jgi:hypothetical protein